MIANSSSSTLICPKTIMIKITRQKLRNGSYKQRFFRQSNRGKSEARKEKKQPLGKN
jgi:hypothetical protein